jgi:hypothetical protein
MKGRPPGYDRGKALALYAEGLPDVEIARRLGLSYSSKVSHFLRSKGLPPKGVCADCGKPFIRETHRAPRCSSCFYHLRAGERVGNFEVLERRGPYCGGFKYLVRDVRCGHQRIVGHMPTQPFVGKFAACGCPTRHVNKYGYAVWLIVTPSGKRLNVLEHRIVKERELGRELRDDETVHHINGIKDDNRPENLQLRQGRHGKGTVFHCLDCGSVNVGAAPLAEAN